MVALADNFHPVQYGGEFLCAEYFFVVVFQPLIDGLV